MQKLQKKCGEGTDPSFRQPRFVSNVFAPLEINDGQVECLGTQVDIPDIKIAVDNTLLKADLAKKSFFEIVMIDEFGSKKGGR